jgi:hypothetical protein
LLWRCPSLRLSSATPRTDPLILGVLVVVLSAEATKQRGRIRYRIF